jgi:hypothetical protein
MCYLKMLKVALTFLLPLLLFCSLSAVGQIADPIKPCYNLSMVPSFFKTYPVPDYASIEELESRKAIYLHRKKCLNNAAQAVPRVNHERPFIENATFPLYLENTTYWFNENLHVGHVHYDIVLMQILQSTKVDRIIMQRSACSYNLCAGIGTIDSFYKGYFAALFSAFNQPNIPVYIRYTHTQKEVKPLYFSNKTKDFYKLELIEQEKYKEIPLQHIMCFETAIRRSKADFGSTATVSTSAVQQFKTSAYRMWNHRYMNELKLSK